MANYQLEESFYGTKFWFKIGTSQLHRDDDLPALEYANGDQFWYKNGVQHRENDQPAVVFTNGDKHWYMYGLRHRENDQPAIESLLTGDKSWWVNGNLHRENDFPAVELGSGYKSWCICGKLHRENGKPAMTWTNGDKRWFINDIDITAFQKKYMAARKLRAQKKIYFWIIKKLYRPGSDSAKRLAEISWNKLKK